MIILVIEILLVFLSSYLFTARLFKIRLFTEFVLVWFILFFAQIILVELSLGSLAKLYLANILFVHFLVFLSALILPRKKQADNILKPNIDLLPDSKLLFLFFSIFTCFFLVKIFVNLISPPNSPDSLQYHLAFPAVWIGSGNLNNPVNIFGAIPMLFPRALEVSATSYYPINAQLFFTWLMLPLRNAFLADLGEAPFYIIGMIAVYAILRRYAVSRKICLLSSFLWVLMPNIFKQLKTGSLIDVICAVLFLLVFYSALLIKTKFTFKNSIIFGICAGIFAGTKVTNLVWLAALLPFICYALYAGAKVAKLSAARLAAFLSSIIFMVILFGGFVYLKNYILTGNPLFPVDLKIFGKTIFPGLFDNASYKMQIAPKDSFNLTRLIFKEGLGPQFLLLILPGTFLPLIMFRYLKSKCHPWIEYLLLFATPLIMFVIYRLLVNVYLARYLFAILSLGLVTAIIFVTRFKKGDKYITAVSVFSILVIFSELARGNELVVSILLSLAMFIALVIYKKQLLLFYKSKTFGKVMLSGALVVVCLLIYLNRDYNKKEFDRYPSSFSKRESWQADIGRGWKALNELTKQGAFVAYTGRMEFYPLFGSGLKNTVKYVSINKKEVTPYNYPDGLFRKVRDFTVWRENLRKEKIEYLFVALSFPDNRETPDAKAFPVEDEWAKAHPEDFKLLFSNSLSHIYKVIIEK